MDDTTTIPTTIVIELPTRLLHPFHVDGHADLIINGPTGRYDLYKLDNVVFRLAT